MIEARRIEGVCCEDRDDCLSVRGAFTHLQSNFPRLAVSIALAIYMVGFAAAAPRVQAPDDPIVTRVVEEYFASQPGYEKGDLITRSQIDKIIAQLVSGGVKISDPASVSKLGMADDSFLARELSTPEGRKFMRRIARHAGSYAHVDRLSTIPQGQKLVDDLIHMKDGDLMIEYMVTTKGGKTMGSMMAQPRGGVNLNKPTGRIYTADELIAALKIAIAKP